MVILVNFACNYPPCYWTSYKMFMSGRNVHDESMLPYCAEDDLFTYLFIYSICITNIIYFSMMIIFYVCAVPK